MYTCVLLRIVSLVFSLYSATSDTVGGLDKHFLSGTNESSRSSNLRSIRDWARCDGSNERDALATAFHEASGNAFVLSIDCNIKIGIGDDIGKPIFIEPNTSVICRNGAIELDNSGIPAFVIANTNNVYLSGWKITYAGANPVSMDRYGYHRNGNYILLKGRFQPAAAFNDQTLTAWLASNHRILFGRKTSVWVGPTNSSSIFYISGSSRNIIFRDFTVKSADLQDASKYIPMFISSTAGYRDNENLIENMGATDTPTNLIFDNIYLDGYYMGFQGVFNITKFSRIRAFHYSDLQDSSGENVGGIEKWFAPPHLFYINSNPQYNASSNDIAIEDVIDFGLRVGKARDKGGKDSISGYAASLKLGCAHCLINRYISARKDGVIDFIEGHDMLLSYIFGISDSSFVNGLYPPVRFLNDRYSDVELNNVYIVDVGHSSPIANKAYERRPQNGILYRSVFEYSNGGIRKYGQ